jgi:Zn-finger nucleic acid-binding protein
MDSRGGDPINTASMKCHSCGGALKGPMNFCPYCGVRQDIDLRQMHFRDLSVPDREMPCPSCTKPLHVIEVASAPPMKVERCGGCFGMFFNPGELEAVLHQQTEASVRFDSLMLDQVAADYGFHHEVIYRKCPMCSERMSHLNFGGRSGVILDRCGTHGLWLEGGELRRLAEWWRAGGKLIHQQEEAKRIGRLFAPPPHKANPTGGSIESPEKREEWSWGQPTSAWDVFILGDAAARLLFLIGEAAASIIKD